MGTLIDLTGQIFGNWKVIERIPRAPGEKGSTKWKCICLKCGREYTVLSASLRSGKSTQCVECSNIQKIKDLTGQTINNVKIIEKVYRGDRQELVWRCKCPTCGREDWLIRGSLLRSSNPPSQCSSCSAQNNLKKIEKPFYKDLKGKRFGKLVAIEPTKDRLKTSVVWKCRCDCGNICYKASSYLINGDTTSCGLCNHISKGEEKITDLLKQNNITFIHEYRVNINKHNYRFDFYIPQYNCLIEYDGKQHFQPNEWESVESIQERDKIKNTWALENNFSLIRIPYTHYLKLNVSDLIPSTSPFIHKGEINETN